MAGSHDHTHFSADGRSTFRRLMVTMLLNLVITVAEVIGGILSGSLALISDALHNFSDAVSVIISYAALKLRSRDHSHRHTFGLKRAEIFAAVINSGVLVAVSIFLFYEAVVRLLAPPEVSGGLMTVVAAIGLVANVAGTYLLHRDAQTSINIRSSYLHLLSDAVSSVGVMAGGFAIYYWGIYWVDPLLTIIIGVYIVRASFQILSQAVHILMEGAPPEVSLQEVQRAVEALPEIQDIHHVHMWLVGEKDVHFEAHVNIRDMMTSESDRLRNQVQEILARQFGIFHATIQFECNQCPDSTLVEVREHPH